jgi:hypothetical protein
MLNYVLFLQLLNSLLKELNNKLKKLLKVYNDFFWRLELFKLFNKKKGGNNELILKMK